ncbi:MAG: dihydroorotate dehydrogenase [Thermoplasmatota archaeon]
MVELRTEIDELKFDPPLILASGILGQTADSMGQVLGRGMGAVVTKSIGEKSRKGHPNPSMVKMEHGLLNAMGLPNPGIEEFEKEMDELKKKTQKPIIGSVFASDTSGFQELSSRMEEMGAAAVELNLSCPHAEGYGAAIGTDPDEVKRMVEAVVREVDLPVLAKLPPVNNIVDSAVSSEKAGADAVVAINTVKAMAINFETKTPILGNKVGGYSGPAVKPIGLRCVYEIYEEVDIPIIGCGGVNTGRDALEYILAGASALEIGSVIHYRGKDAPKNIVSEIEELMRSEEIDNISDLIGTAHK